MLDANLNCLIDQKRPFALPPTSGPKTALIIALKPDVSGDPSTDRLALQKGRPVRGGLVWFRRRNAGASEFRLHPD
jgi:hypothetical protein